MITETTNSAGEVIREFQRSAPVDVLGIAERLGINVWQHETLNPDVSGMIMPDRINGGNSGYSIVVRKGDSAERKRFTVAHEIGHFILHRDKVKNGITDDKMYRSGLSSREESEANRMAADILMPYGLIQSLINRGYKTVPELAQQLAVSKQAMSIRLNIPT